MKEGYLFVLFVTLTSPKPRSFCHDLGIIGKSLSNRGVLSWLHNVNRSIHFRKNMYTRISLFLCMHVQTRHNVDSNSKHNNTTL
jgi:hypothetical protein